MARQRRMQIRDFNNTHIHTRKRTQTRTHARTHARAHTHRDGVPASLADSRVALLLPLHASVLGPEHHTKTCYGHREHGAPAEAGGGDVGATCNSCNGSRGVRVLVRAQGVALGAGSGALVLRLNGRLLPASFSLPCVAIPHADDATALETPATPRGGGGGESPNSNRGRERPAQRETRAAGQRDAGASTSSAPLWWVSEVDACVPWDMLPRGSHYLTAALAHVSVAPKPKHATLQPASGAGREEEEKEEEEDAAKAAAAAAAEEVITWVELPGGAGSMVGFRVDDVRWPAVGDGCSIPARNFSGGIGHACQGRDV